MNDRKGPISTLPPNNRSRERLFGVNRAIGLVREFTCGPTHHSTCVFWFENAHAAKLAMRPATLFWRQLVWGIFKERRCFRSARQLGKVAIFICGQNQSTFRRSSALLTSMSALEVRILLPRRFAAICANLSSASVFLI